MGNSLQQKKAEKLYMKSCIISFDVLKLVVVIVAVIVFSLGTMSSEYFFFLLNNPASVRLSKTFNNI